MDPMRLLTLVCLAMVICMALTGSRLPVLIWFAAYYCAAAGDKTWPTRFIGAIVAYYFGALAPFADASGAVVHGMPKARVAIILLFSLVGIAGSYGVAWFGIRINTFANSRTAFASLAGKPFPVYAIPIKAGMSIGMLLISVELLIMLCILLFVPGELAGSCFIGFAIGESLGASALRIAGGIFTKIADIGSDLMKIVFNIKEDDARNPGVIADCTGDNAGDSVGPSADGFETYGVTGVALISFIVLASRAIMTLLKPGDHGSTFGGNPLAAAVGHASLRVLVHEHLAERAAAQGEYLFQKLRALEASCIAEIRGRGLLVGRV